MAWRDRHATVTSIESNLAARFPSSSKYTAPMVVDAEMPDLR